LKKAELGIASQARGSTTIKAAAEIHEGEGSEREKLEVCRKLFTNICSFLPTELYKILFTLIG
jgi:hypothetical protein